MFQQDWKLSRPPGHYVLWTLKTIIKIDQETQKQNEPTCLSIELISFVPFNSKVRYKWTQVKVDHIGSPMSEKTQNQLNFAVPTVIERKSDYTNQNSLTAAKDKKKKQISNLIFSFESQYFIIYCEIIKPIYIGSIKVLLTQPLQFKGRGYPLTINHYYEHTVIIAQVSRLMLVLLVFDLYEKQLCVI